MHEASGPPPFPPAGASRFSFAAVVAASIRERRGYVEVVVRVALKTFISGKLYFKLLFLNNTYILKAPINFLEG